ncbi:hypothetical protein APHCRT_0962 [Anaplasma phagocytophilum str. CRT53-1]|uniref:Uncharacterized protein n=1 Tax=Anaplasma phagocytophilum str. CRT53-1 TaxID=1359157 RepID=A0A0F3Q2R7_ANAPH|nr:hypothetical protein APHCRT_0962 [Anaplasma phagocytophilum str. CRT53-1]
MTCLSSVQVRLLPRSLKQFYQMKRAVYGAVNKIYNKLIYKTHAVS